MTVRCSRSVEADVAARGVGDAGAAEVTVGRVRALLNQIVDPCSVAAGAPAGITEMGLVRSVTVEHSPKGAVVAVTIGLTEPGCMIGASFLARARESLDQLPGVARAEVSLEHDCDWTPADLDGAYAARLAQVRSTRATRAARAARSGSNPRVLSASPRRD